MNVKVIIAALAAIGIGAAAIIGLSCKRKNIRPY